jgi:hypothetical protein
MTRRWFTWRCAGGHHGAGWTLPELCPLAYCRQTVKVYGPDRRKVPTG